jgi:hypothetical protein
VAESSTCTKRSTRAADASLRLWQEGGHRTARRRQAGDELQIDPGVVGVYEPDGSGKRRKVVVGAGRCFQRYRELVNARRPAG